MTNDSIREEAVFKRYGKKLNISVSNRINDAGEVIESSCKFISPKGKVYFLNEYLKDGLTDLVILKYDDKERHFKDHLRGEISLIDLISEE